MARLMIFGVEEHSWTTGIRDALTSLPEHRRDPSVGYFNTGKTDERLLDYDEERLRDMDAVGMDMAVLSVTTPATQILDPADATRCSTTRTSRRSWTKAARPGTPIFIHPQIPSKAVRNIYYGGLPDELSFTLAAGVWGWHMETAINALRLMLSGTFERAPDLQIILGHWREMLPLYLERVEVAPPPTTCPNQRRNTSGTTSTSARAESEAGRCSPTH